MGNLKRNSFSGEKRTAVKVATYPSTVLTACPANPAKQRTFKRCALKGFTFCYAQQVTNLFHLLKQTSLVEGQLSDSITLTTSAHSPDFLGWDAVPDLQTVRSEEEVRHERKTDKDTKGKSCRSHPLLPVQDDDDDLGPVLVNRPQN